MAKALYKSVKISELKSILKNGDVRINEKCINHDYIFEIIKKDYLDNKNKYEELFKNHLLFINYMNKMNQKKNSKYLTAEVYLPNFINETMNFYKENVPLGFIPIESLDNLFREVHAVNWNKYPEIKQEAELHWVELRDKIYHQFEDVLNSCRMTTFTKKPQKDDNSYLLINGEEVNKFKTCKKLPKCRLIKNIIKGLLIFEAINLSCESLDFFLSMDLIELFKYKDNSVLDNYYYLVSKYSTRSPKGKVNGFYHLGELKKLVIKDDETITEDELDKIVNDNHIKKVIKK